MWLLALPLFWSGCAADSSVSRKTTKADRMCEKLPACRGYVAALKEQVYEQWRSTDASPGASVVIGMRIDGSGNPLDVRTVRADSEDLGRGCRAAIGYAAPFGPLPASLLFLNRNEITIEFVARTPRAK
jgi:hypothetical protein